MVAPPEHEKSDVTTGSISAETNDRRRKKQIPIPSEGLVQCLYRTDEAQRQLAPCFLAVVYTNSTLLQKKRKRRPKSS